MYGNLHRKKYFCRLRSPTFGWRYIIYIDHIEIFFGVFIDRDEIKVNNNAKKKKNEAANVTEQGWQEMARERFLAGATREIPVGQDGPMLENPNPCLKIFAAWHRNTTFLNHCFYFLPYSDCVNEMQDKDCEDYANDCKEEERYAYHRHIWEYCSKTCNRKYMKIHNVDQRLDENWLLTMKKFITPEFRH